MVSPLLAIAAVTVFAVPAFTLASAGVERKQACDALFTNSTCTYDYIVVGGGTAGLVVAARLSENPQVTVAVIEAGGSGKGDDRIDVPAFIGSPFGSSIDWNVNTVPQKFSNNLVYNWPRGKVLGGSSALNFLVWDRAAKVEYDAWEKLGNPGWNWKTIFNTVRNDVEHFHKPPKVVGDKFGIHPQTKFQGTTGPVQTSISAFIPDFALAWLPGLKLLGVPPCSDPLSGDNNGATFSPSAIDPKTRARSYSASAYLWPHIGRKNLVVLANATATKVNLSENYKGLYEATGVNFFSRGKNYTVNAAREVILSAGTVNTPQLLELSGIGQPEILKKFDIPVKINLPGVGENLQDHLCITNAYLLKPGNPTPDLLRQNVTFAAEQLALWRAGKPSLEDSAVAGIAYNTLPQLFGKSKASSLVTLARSETKNPGHFQKQYDLQYSFLADSGTGGIGQVELILSNGFSAPGGAPTAGSTYASFVAALQHPFSRGNIHITTSDPFTLPAADPHYLEKSFDLELLSLGSQIIRKLSKTGPWAKYIVNETAPGPDVQTDEQFREYVKKFMVTEYHPIGTASLLPKKDGGVVDPTLKVYGTTNLRVADASIMPLHISAHIQATTFAIGELAAKFVRASQP